MTFNRFSPVDPNSLPMISLVAIPDVEALIAARMNEVKARWSFYDPPLGAQYDVQGLEFDPIKITMEAGASSEINALSFVNAMGKATTLAFAVGGDLDALASRYPGGVPRLNKGLPNEEKDDRYRYRIWLAANSFSTAGAALAYVFQALTAVPELRDATAIVRRDSFEKEPQVIITCLIEGAPGATDPDPIKAALARWANPVPSTAQLLAVRTRVTDKSIGPLTDVVVVNGAQIIPVDYRIRVWFYFGADVGAALNTIGIAVAKMIDNQRYLGFSNTLAAINAACWQYGVSNVIIDEPGGDAIVDETQAVLVNSVIIDPRSELAFPQNRIVVAGMADSMEGADVPAMNVFDLTESFVVLAGVEGGDAAFGWGTRT